MSLRFIEQMYPLLEAPGDEAWFGALENLAASQGFDRVLLAVLPRPGLPLEDAFVRTNYPLPWRETYDEQKLAYVDPTVIHSTSRTTPLVWSPELFVTPRQLTMYEEARSYGLHIGLTLPIHGPRRETGMLCFADDSPSPADFIARTNGALPELALMRDLVLESGQRYLNDYIQPRLPKLTIRELECLKWTALGKSTWDISRILRCSEAVVNFHMKNIRQKFGVSSRRAAAVIATQMGLIDPR